MQDHRLPADLVMFDCPNCVLWVIDGIEVEMSRNELEALTGNGVSALASVVRWRLEKQGWTERAQLN